MKILHFLVVASVIFGGNLFSAAFVWEDENYVTIFDTTTFLGDRNFNLIRLYKADVKPRFRKVIPSHFSYADDYEAMLLDFRLSAGIKQLSLGYKKVVTDQSNKDYFYQAFSSAVDTYLFEQLAISSTDRYQGECSVWSIPGEIIYFDEETKEPCMVEVGAFQYSIDADGLCSTRFFKLYGRSYLVVGKEQEVHRCWKAYGYLDHTAVSDQIARFLAEQKTVGCAILSKAWCKEVAYCINRCDSESSVAFL